MKESVFNYHPLNVDVFSGGHLWYVGSDCYLEMSTRASFKTLRI